MKTWILGISLLLFSCSPELEPKVDTFQDWYKDPIRFIVENPYSPLLDSAVKRHTFILDSAWDVQGIPPWHCGANCLYISAYGQDVLLIELDTFSIDSVRKEVYNFLYNPMDSSRYSEQSIAQSENGITYKISKGHVFLELWPCLNSYSKTVLQNISFGIIDYKEQLSRDAYNLPFSKLDSTKTEILNQLCAKKLGILEFYIVPPPPPPPPFDTLQY